jgi:hypothetical protein
MFCGIGRDKSNKDCKKPPKIYKHPSTSPLTVKKQADKKSSSGVSVSPISFDEKYAKAVKLLDVKDVAAERAAKAGLVLVGKTPGKARGLPAYKTKKAGKRRRKKRKTRKRRKTKKKRKRKRRKSKRRK